MNAFGQGEVEELLAKLRRLLDDAQTHHAELADRLDEAERDRDHWKAKAAFWEAMSKGEYP